MNSARALLLFCLFFCVGCVGKTFGNMDELEEFPFRDPTTSERKTMEACIRHLYKAQLDFKAKHKRFSTKTGPLAKNAPCDDLRVRTVGDGERFIITIQFNSGETTVKWDVDERGIVTEYGETDTDGIESF